MNEQQFDCPYPEDDEKMAEMTKRLIADNWEVSNENWNGMQPLDYYRGMLSLVRAAQSLILCEMPKQEQSDDISQIGLDLLILINKNKKSIIIQ